MSDYIPGCTPRARSATARRPGGASPEDFGKLFYLTRKWAAVSHSKIAASCGIKPERVGRLARGDGAVTTYDKILQICDGMRIPATSSDCCPGRGRSSRTRSAIPRHNVRTVHWDYRAAQCRDGSRTVDGT